jgi:hypothetical protein
MENLARQQDGSGAGAKDRLDGAELPQSRKEAVLFQKFQHGGGFAAGHYETIQAGKLAGLADLDRHRASLSQSLRVAGVVTLNG